MIRNVLVLLNDSAGSAHGVEPEIAAAFSLLGIAATIRRISRSTCGACLEEVAAEVVSGTFVHDALVVAGGDGTIGAAAGALAGSTVPLGILPLGTLNHFARDIGLPGSIPDAAAVIASGARRLVDLGTVNGRAFVNNSSIGLYPFIVARRTKEQRQRRVGKIAATAFALARVLRHSPWSRCRVTVNGDTRTVRTACVFVGNNFYDLTRRGTRARLDEGRLCIYIVTPQTWLGLLLLPLRIALGRSLPEREIVLVTAQEAQISVHRKHLHVALDGEALVLPTPLVYRSLPRHLFVIAPDNTA